MPIRHDRGPGLLGSPVPSLARRDPGGPNSIAILVVDLG